MKLLYGVKELLPLAEEFGRQRSGGNPHVSEAKLAIAANPARLPAPERLRVFAGTITGLDDDSEELFVTVRAEDGAEREFAAAGAPSEYRLGRRMIVRYVVESRLPGGDEIIDVMEIWLE
jgi:hypothetical protein